jgi:site-specific DNA recombinase
MKRAVIYARVSTPKQAEADLSIPDQLRACAIYCEQQGWQMVGQYTDAGLTATDDNRPDFQRMVEDVLSGTGGFEIIVVHSQSRFFRDNFQTEIYRRRLLKFGVEVVSATQDFGTGPLADLIRQILWTNGRIFFEREREACTPGYEGKRPTRIRQWNSAVWL